MSAEKDEESTRSRIKTRVSNEKTTQYIATATKASNTTTNTFNSYNQRIVCTIDSIQCCTTPGRRSTREVGSWCRSASSQSVGGHMHRRGAQCIHRRMGPLSGTPVRLEPDRETATMLKSDCKCPLSVLSQQRNAVNDACECVSQQSRVSI